MLGAGWRLLPAELWAYSVAILVVPVLFASASNPLVSIPRFVLAAFPLFIVLGATVLKHRKVLVWWLSVSAAISSVFNTLFMGWYLVT